MTDQEIEIVRRVLIICACVIVTSGLLLWDHMSKNAKLAAGIGAFVFLVLWALIG